MIKLYGGIIMNNKVKKSFCALLAGMMMVTSGSIAALADDNTSATAETTATAGTTAAPETTATAETTAAPEATATPETTATSTAATGYDNDNTYQAALKVCSSLGIITGYDDGSIKPESNVTRAEMATIILRMLAEKTNTTYQNVFNDVTSDHWAANTIQTAVELSIVDGMGDGTFVPDGNVKYEQVIKMIVAALGYTVDAERAGGYPAGYLSVGGNLKILQGVNGKQGEDMQRGEVIKAVYNALLADYREMVGTEKGNPVYKSENTLGYTKFDLIEDKGVLTATPDISITTGITKMNGIVVIDGTRYKCNFNVDEYLGTKVKFYYRENTADDPELVAVVKTGTTTSLDINADKISSIDMSKGDLRVYTSEQSSSTKRYDISEATVIYNGTVLTAADYANTGKTGTYEEFITPEVGDIKITDYDNDGKYDVVFVNSYETMLVTNATSEKLTGKINNVSTTIEYDDGDANQTIKVKKSGVDAAIKNLRKNDIASIKRNVDNSILDITVVNEAITGAITSVGNDSRTVTTSSGDRVYEYKTVNINGQTYEVDKNVSDSDLKVGVTGTFNLDMFDRIGYVADTSSTSDKYGIVTNVFYDDENELVVRLFTQEGKQLDAKPASNISFWAPNATSAVSKASESTIYNSLSSDSNFLKINNNPVKACKYRLNSNNELTRLYLAVDQDKVSDTDAMRIYNKNLNGVGGLAGTVAGYTIKDGIMQFTIPNSVSDRTSPSNYSVSTAKASTYTNYDGGASVDYAIGDFKDTKYPQIILRFETGGSSVKALSDMDTASSANMVMVSKINDAVDDEGNEICEIVGYSNGTEVSYLTTDVTGVYDFTGWSDANYAGNMLYDATNNDTSVLKSALKPGDVLAVRTDDGGATLLVRMASVDNVVSSVLKGASDTSGLLLATGGSSAKGSSTRDKYHTGFVSNVDLEDSAFISLADWAGNSGTVTYDLSSAFSAVTVKINEDGKILDTKVDKNGGFEAGELYAVGDDENKFDYAVFKSFKGSMGLGFIIRVEINR